MSVRADIGIQPPKKVQIGETIRQSVIVRFDISCIEEGYYCFAMPVLIGASSHLPENVLVGGGIIMATLVPEELGCSAVFVAPNFVITHSGKYRLRVDIYKVAYSDPNGATLLAQLTTSRISAREGRAPEHIPTNEERAFIDALVAADVPLN
ncbi:hypothetical protein B0T10DRAFT_577820 [Thelonectria olida]|uniref:Velvet domain-containing protein n=1 Tax=Thelonectria olida TaxID=1576542 RepID=A0A9P8WG51_9HYPO|nr:hypothetical protein B0T10DRAFT_577820 [Thelonectria olida]